MYEPHRPARSLTVPVRGLDYHVRCWGPEPALTDAARSVAATDAEATPVVLLHGWMDVSASFQFLVDAFARERTVYAPDWRGYGLTGRQPGVDAYWFPDYLADLDALLDVLSPGRPVDLVAHSMGGNVACLYAGVRPERVRRLVNLEGYGLPDTVPAQAPGRYAKWLDELREPAPARAWPSAATLAERLRRNDPRLSADRADWLARQWAREDADGWRLQADPAHRRTNPILYRVDEVLACWRRITAPVLLVEGDSPDDWHRFTREPAYRARLEAFGRLRAVTVADSGHMLHHDQPERVAALVEAFLDDPSP